jgi:hypothetical protein
VRQAREIDQLGAVGLGDDRAPLLTVVVTGDDERRTAERRN